jgi:hypothetical protein
MRIKKERKGDMNKRKAFFVHTIKTYRRGVGRLEV